MPPPTCCVPLQNVPTNKLHNCGYISIGCEPCTRPVLPNQAEREGRWWWEDAAAKECGLHSGNIKKADGTTEERKAERDLWPAGEAGQEEPGAAYIARAEWNATIARVQREVKGGEDLGDETAVCGMQSDDVVENGCCAFGRAFFVSEHVLTCVILPAPLHL